MSDLGSLAVGLVMAGSLAIGATRRLLERRRARSQLVSRPDLADLADPEDGTVVRVTGTVRAVDSGDAEPGPDLLRAPISGTPCVVYRARVTRSGTTSSKPRESLAMVPFVLERDTGERVTVEGAHALLDLPNTLARAKSSDDRDRRATFLLLHGFPASAPGAFDEVIVTVGMRVTVAGLVMKEPGGVPDGEAGYRDGAKPALRLAGDLAHPLVIGQPDERP
jgi:hypothetical protein